jgi:hypothetical protein
MHLLCGILSGELVTGILTELPHNAVTTVPAGQAPGFSVIPCRIEAAGGTIQNTMLSPMASEAPSCLRHHVTPDLQTTQQEPFAGHWMAFGHLQEVDLTVSKNDADSVSSPVNSLGE